jgi:hypothetical protein
MLLPTTLLVEKVFSFLSPSLPPSLSGLELKKGIRTIQLLPLKKHRADVQPEVLQVGWEEGRDEKCLGREEAGREEWREE